MVQSQNDLQMIMVNEVLNFISFASFIIKIQCLVYSALIMMSIVNMVVMVFEGYGVWYLVVDIWLSSIPPGFGCQRGNRYRHVGF